MLVLADQAPLLTPNDRLEVKQVYYICSFISNNYLPVSTRKYNRDEAFRLANKKTLEGCGLVYVAIPEEELENDIPKEQCRECEGVGQIEVSINNHPYEMTIINCPDCKGLGIIDVKVPSQNTLPVEALVASTELPF